MWRILHPDGRITIEQYRDAAEILAKYRAEGYEVVKSGFCYTVTVWPE